MSIRVQAAHAAMSATQASDVQKAAQTLLESAAQTIATQGPVRLTNAVTLAGNAATLAQTINAPGSAEAAALLTRLSQGAQALAPLIAAGNDPLTALAAQLQIGSVNLTDLGREALTLAALTANRNPDPQIRAAAPLLAMLARTALTGASMQNTLLSLLPVLAAIISGNVATRSGELVSSDRFLPGQQQHAATTLLYAAGRTGSA